MSLFLRLLDVPTDEKAVALLVAVREGGDRLFEPEPKNFAQVPGSPFSYWVSQQVRSTFGRLPSFRERHFSVRGAYTTDDFRFYRLSWEAPPNLIALTREETKRGCLFVPLAKGGQYSRFYSDVYLAIRWANDGYEAKAFLAAYRERKGWGTDWSACLNGYDYYFRPGLTWSRRTQRGLGLRVIPAGCIFSDKGPAAFGEKDDPEGLLALLSLTTSSAFRYLVELQMAFGSYEVGVIQRTPVPDLSSPDRDVFAQLARRAWSLKRALDTINETSHAFLLPAALRSRLGPLDPRTLEEELVEIHSTIDNLAFRAYELNNEDRTAIEAWATKSKTSNVDTDEPDDSDDGVEEVDSTDTVAALQSWAVGVAFGRFDLRLATGERQPPPEPEPFVPLPTRSPGMIPEADDSQFPARPVLLDDLGHALDLTAQVGAVLERVGSAPENSDTLRRWLARDFFPLHIKMYSKSRRKAPIYWQLATPSASYSIWLYIHAFTSDTLYKAQETAETKLRHEKMKLDGLRADLGPNLKAADRKTLAAQETFVEELRTYLDAVKRVAPLWKADLDDGVIINFAPLWRLVPHHKPWQKELKATWDALCAGDYDWAHLAMHLWPERVVPQCATDRSLAIAHGLEEIFWIEGQDGKWKPRPTPARPVAELVGERTSPAVKAALKSLLEAPVATGGGRARGRRATTGGDS